MLRSASLALALSLVAAHAVAQQAPGIEKGFVPDKAYHFGDVDVVNTFNGNLSLHIPIGPSYPVNAGFSYSLNLVYNSKVWDYEPANQSTRATPNRRSNAGVGWLLSLGRLVVPMSSTNPTVRTVYESPDGEERTLEDPLHPGFTNTPSGNITEVGFSGDGTYLRRLDTTSGTTLVESPDGLIRIFETSSGKLQSMKDRFGNGIFVDYLSSISGTPCPAGDTFAWRISDNSNEAQSARSNYVCFKSSIYPFSTYDGQIERVVLAAPPATAGGTPRSAIYTFVYNDRVLDRGCGSNIPNDPTVPAPMLEQLGLPDGSSYFFAYNLHAVSGCDMGTLNAVTLPTGATISYAYSQHGMVTQRCDAKNPFYTAVVGVSSRTASGPHVTTGTWTYSWALNEQSVYVQCDTAFRRAPPDQLIATVTDPLGNVTENYYSVWVGADAFYDSNHNLLVSGPPASEHGILKEEFALPLTRLSGTSSGGKFLSRSVYSADGYAATPKRPLRLYFVQYERDTSDCTAQDGIVESCTNGNRRVVAERVVNYNEAGAVIDTADTSYSDYDGLGHYRQTTLGGSFASGNATSTVAFNKRDPDVNPSSGINSGTYPGTFVLPALSDSWLLNLASSATHTEAGASSVAQNCFDPSTGFLRGTRVLNGTNRSTPLLTLYTSDVHASNGADAGNVIAEKFFGGDVQAGVPDAPLCSIADAPPATAEYEIDHTYMWGVRKTSKYANATFFALNRTIDRTTGLTYSATDAAGNTTTYSYDGAFRLTSIQPPGTLAATTYTFTNFSSNPSFTPATIDVSRSAAGLGTIESVYQYDSLGRLWREKQKMADGDWSLRETLYGANGWTANTSERERLVPNPTEFDFTPIHKTLFNSYDALGRVTSITTPDSSPEFFTYSGASAKTRTLKVATGPTETAVETTENYDRQGRLTSVTENDEAPGSVTTSYTYDFGGRLATVTMPGEGGNQTRAFAYDPRGFLSSEQHPELGASGYGTTQYLSYDSRGHAHRRVTGSDDVTMTYDNAERVTLVGETSSGNPLKQFAYDDPSGASYPQCASNKCNGKLAAAARWNYFGSAPADLGTVAVTEGIYYDGPGGLPSRHVWTEGLNGTSFFFDQSYNAFGEILSVQYPCRGNATCSDSTRTVTNGYTNGFLSSVGSGYASSITYQPSGAIDTVTHGLGSSAIRETWSADPSGLPRPAQIRALNASSQELWSTGTYAYDGSGNIKQIGALTYRYDPFNRLAGWTETLPTGGYNATSLAYDTFGNQLGRSYKGCGPNPADACFKSTFAAHQVSGTTNHYTDHSYDAAGNVIASPGKTFIYDMLGVTKTASVSGRNFRYIYTSDDERIGIVERVLGGDSIVRNRINWTLRNFSNQLLRTYLDDSTSGTRVVTWKEDQIWRGGLSLASETTSGARHFSLDHLGSPRLITGGTGLQIGAQNFESFGAGGSSDGGALQFTGQERDAANIAGGASDLPDYFHARYYVPAAGRFLSLDQHPGRSNRPQSWNRYVYVSNNPLANVDPDGQDEYYFVWKSGPHEAGHAAVGVDNRDKNGNRTGSLTVRHLWPGRDQETSKLHKTLKASADYRTAIIPASDIRKFDGGEGRSADGIVRIKGDASQDASVNAALASYAKDNSKYVAPSVTCSTFAAAGVSATGIPVTETGTVTVRGEGLLGGAIVKSDVTTPVAVYDSIVNSGDPRVDLIQPIVPIGPVSPNINIERP